VPEIIKQGRETYDLEERKQLYLELDKINLVDQVFLIPLLMSGARAALRNNINNGDVALYYPRTPAFKYLFTS